MSEERETSSNTSSINNNDDNNNNNNNNNGTCVVCYKNVEIYSIGMCEHPVCYECSTRMRVLCRQNECPICRQDLPKVVFIKKIKPFRDIIKGNLLDTRYNIFFDNTYIQEKFTRLLSHICPICKGNKKLFGAFTGLKDHMRREHDLHYCDLCVDNLKIFTNERRCYTRFDLGLHRRKGDKDDKSHRGHPLCEFCECRYMDNDELFRHLRRDHLFCHFCDADGLHQYYNSYDYLRDHFSKEHYLCEEGPCADEKFTSVFRSDIDLKAHKSSVHSKFMGKAAAKQARTLELEFTLAPRGDNNRNNRRGHQQSNNNNQTLSSPSSSSYNSRNNNTRDYYDTTDGDSSYLHESEMPSASSMKQPDVQSTQEFPSLGNAGAAASSSSTTTGPVNFSHTKSKGGRGGNLTIRGSFGSQKLSINNENFPALGSSDNGSNSGLSNIVNLNVYSSSSSSGGGSSSNNNNNNNITKNNNNNNNNNKTSSSVIQTSSSPNVSIQVNHKTNGNNITTRLSRPTLKPVAQLSKKTDDFPALGGNCTSAKNSTHSTTQNTGQWTKVTCVKPSVVQQSKKIIQTPPKFTNSISEAFPSLPKTAKDKKKSSTLSVTTTNNNTITKIQKNDAPPSPSSSSSSSSVTAAAAAAAVVKNTKNNVTNDNSKKKKKKKTKTTTLTSNNSSSNESVVSKIIEKKNDDKKKPTDNTDLQDNNNSTKNITRKRSELKIDNLKNNISKKNNDVVDDFPALGSPKTSTPLKPPPGFSTTRPPPPPGFAVKINSIVRPQKYENNLTFTNSSGQNFPILPDKNNKKYTYSPPPDFQQRNKNLVAKISSILELKDAIEEFRYLSGLFRQDMCTAEDYYKRCRMEMGLSEFLIIFPEILVLLPDINKQRELYNLHKHETNGQIKGLELCTICGQVCKSESDIVSHLSGHTLEHDFPALGLATGTQTSNNNWPRKNT